jgi:hypothetical protein
MPGWFLMDSWMKALCLSFIPLTLTRPTLEMQIQGTENHSKDQDVTNAVHPNE